MYQVWISDPRSNITWLWRSEKTKKAAQKELDEYKRLWPSYVYWIKNTDRGK